MPRSWTISNPARANISSSRKGFGGFSNTPLDTILRNMGVTTCVVSGVTTCVCVSTTVRGGVDHNYRMILVGDAVAEVSRETHEAELKTMDRVFADVKTTDEVVAMLGELGNVLLFGRKQGRARRVQKVLDDCRTTGSPTLGRITAPHPVRFARWMQTISVHPSYRPSSST